MVKSIWQKDIIVGRKSYPRNTPLSQILRQTPPTGQGRMLNDCPLPVVTPHPGELTLIGAWFSTYYIRKLNSAGGADVEVEKLATRSNLN